MFSDLCTVQDDRSHTDQAAVPDRTAMDNRIVSHRHIIADHRRSASVRVDRRIILDIAAPADPDAVIIPAQDRVKQDAGIVSDRHVADDHRSFCNAGCIAYIF